MEMKETMEEVSVSSPVQLDTTEAEAMVLEEKEQAAAQAAMGPRRSSQMPEGLLEQEAQHIKGSKVYKDRDVDKTERKKKRKSKDASRKANRS